MEFNFITIILLLASAQGFFLALIIFHKHGKLYANRFLGFLIFIYSLVLLNLFFSDMGYYEGYPILSLIPIGVPFIIGPLHYLYIKYLTQHSSKFRKYAMLHFIPAVFTVLFFLISYYGQVFGQDLFNYRISDNYPFIFIIFNWLLIIQAMTYVVLSLLLIKKYSRYFKDAFSSLEQIRLDWIRNLTFFVAGGLMIFALENLLFQLGINLSNYFMLSSAVIAVYVYTLGYTGFVKSDIFEQPDTARSMEQLPLVSYQFHQERSENKTTTREKYEKSGLSKEKSEELSKRLKTFMKENQPFKESNLSLHQLAEMLDITPHNLSEVINTGLQMNFFDFVNKYRVERVKEDILDSNKKHLTLLSIALDAGFNSKSSFNSIFKKHTGLTPSGFRTKLKKKY